MLENFVYSLNATIPVFLVIVLGYLLGRAKMLNDNFVTVANRLTYSITLPVMLFLEFLAKACGRLMARINEVGAFSQEEREELEQAIAQFGAQPEATPDAEHQ